MPVDTLFEKLRFAERRLTAAEERVVFCRAAAAKASAVLAVNVFQDRATSPPTRTPLSA